MLAKLSSRYLKSGSFVLKVVRNIGSFNSLQSYIKPQNMNMDQELILKKIACDAIDLNSVQLKALSQDIWNNPELCFEEYHAHKNLADFLEERGFTVERGYKLPTAFRAQLSHLKNSKVSQSAKCTNVAVLCEYDALPDIGHACGHNLIAMVGIATSLGIKAAMESSTFDGYQGMLTVLGTPAEEGGGGKIDLINAGAFKDVDIAMMAHPSQLTLPQPVYVSLTEVKITYFGRASHAASYPWDGINALDAAVSCYTNISHLRQQMKPTWRAHGVITNGGAKPSIIPEKSELEYYLRTPSGEELEILKQMVTGCILGAAQSSGCKVEYKFSLKPYLSLISNKTMASLYVENGQKVAIQFETDPDKINRQGGSTDMGNVSHIVPSIHPKFHIGTLASQHTPEFATHARTDEAESYSLTVAKALAMTAIDVLIKPHLLQQIKEEFSSHLAMGKLSSTK